MTSLRRLAGPVALFTLATLMGCQVPMPMSVRPATSASAVRQPCPACSDAPSGRASRLDLDPVREAYLVQRQLARAELISLAEIRRSAFRHVCADTEPGRGVTSLRVHSPDAERESVCLASPAGSANLSRVDNDLQLAYQLLVGSVFCHDRNGYIFPFRGFPSRIAQEQGVVCTDQLGRPVYSILPDEAEEDYVLESAVGQSVEIEIPLRLPPSSSGGSAPSASSLPSTGGTGIN